MTIYLTLIKLSSLILGLYFFKSINVVNDSPEYYYKKIHSLKRAYSALFGLLFISFIFPFLPIEKIKNSLPSFSTIKEKSDFDPTLFYGDWDIQGEVGTVTYRRNRAFLLGDNKGKWSVKHDTLYVKFDNQMTTQKYIINSLTDDYYELIKHPKGEIFNAIKID